MQNAPVRQAILTLLAAFCIAISSGCVYKIPITEQATRKVQQPLLGNWVSADGKNQLKVRKLDDSRYILALNSHLFLAHHSDLANTAFASVQEIETPARQYSYITWSLSADGQRLYWQAVNRKLISPDITMPTTMQTRLKTQLGNAALLESRQEYLKENLPQASE